MDPGAFDADDYKAQLQRKMRASEVIVFDAVFTPTELIKELYLVAATSSGMVHVFALDPLFQQDYWDQVAANKADKQPRPSLSFQAHPNQIYSLSFAGDASNPILVTGGDQDFRVWHWKDITAKAHQKTARISPTSIHQLQRKPLDNRGSLPCLSEINAIAASSLSPSIFLAAGDGRAHEFDLSSQSFVRTFDGHTNYLHAASTFDHSKEIATGSEDGTIGIWDTRSTTSTFLRPCQPTSDYWVGSVEKDASGTWLVAGGGQQRTLGQNQEEGFLGMWHLPSRTLVQVTSTPSDVHDIAVNGSEVLTVGNDAGLRKWNRSSAELMSTTKASVPSGRFCASHEEGEVVAVGGAGPLIDIFTLPGVVSFSLLVDESA